MPSCTTCGDENFEEQDGHFYCTTCNTQSQDFRVVEQDEEEGTLNYTQRVKEKQQRIRKVWDNGRPWSTYEAYEIILLHQVEALIEMGAQPRLKDVVFKLWTNYMHKLGVAFSDQPPAPQLRKYERQRELFPGTTSDAAIKNVYLRRRRKKSVAPSRKKVQEQMEQDAIERLLEGAEFDEGDHPTLLLDDTRTGGGATRAGATKGRGEESLGWCTDEESDDDGNWGRYRKGIDHKSVYKTKMMTLLCLCYIGLLYTNPLVTVADMIRWARNEKVPFKNVMPLLPDDMKFFINDWKLFMGVIPSHFLCRYHIGRLIKLVNPGALPNVPHISLLNKYILDLHLPVEIHGFAVNILMSVMLKPILFVNSAAKTITFWEAILMSIIIITVKLIFGLNDVTEKHMSECSRSLVKALGKKGELFAWDDWVVFKKRESLLRQITSTGNIESYVESSVNNFLVREVKSIRFSTRPSKHLKYQSAYLDSLTATFTDLERRMNKGSATATSQSLSNQSIPGNHGYDPFSSSNRLDDDLESLTLETGDVTGNEGREAEEERERLLQERKEIERQGNIFRSSTVLHLISPDVFLQEQGVSELGADVSTAMESDWDDTVMGDLERATPRKKSRRADVSETLDSPPSGSRSSEARSTQSVNVRKCQKIIRKICNLKDEFLVSFTFEGDSKVRSTSYSWLLEFCSRMIECDAHLLHQEVAKMELKVFGDGEPKEMTKKLLKMKPRMSKMQQFYDNYNFL